MRRRLTVVLAAVSLAGACTPLDGTKSGPVGPPRGEAELRRLEHAAFCDWVTSARARYGFPTSDADCADARADIERLCSSSDAALARTFERGEQNWLIHERRPPGLWTNHLLSGMRIACADRVERFEQRP